MYYHIFNNWYKLINIDPAEKIGHRIQSHDFMDREYTFLNSYKVNGKCLYQVKWSKMCLIYEVKWAMCGAIDIEKRQQTFKKIMYGHLYDVQHILKNGKKSDSSAAHYEKNSNLLHTHWIT